MDTMEVVYLICFFVGFGFAVLSGLLSGVFSGGAEAHVDAGGAHVDAGGGGTDGSVHFSPLSPVTLATFIASFGGAGIIFKKVAGLPALAHVPLATLSAFAVAGVVFLLFYKLFSITQASSGAREGEVIGMPAEVTVPIPNHGVGEIAYTVAGLRQTAPARTEDGKEVPARVTVTIVQQAGNVYVVRKAT